MCLTTNSKVKYHKEHRSLGKINPPLKGILAFVVFLLNKVVTGLTHHHCHNTQRKKKKKRRKC
ncbi:hypothetical protein F2Q68_00024637 [Brassica cretica]|uniref:Uncharacterized protein n=1 Tax=Brassica cretica TaxID=69181 RepID=A0A8S9II61_BRACR|nr:hypothetical protein F2Q68_00024637 [Brassica cretica]